MDFSLEVGESNHPTNYLSTYKRRLAFISPNKFMAAQSLQRPKLMALIALTPMD